jgi:chromosome segregation ATPase
MARERHSCDHVRFHTTQCGAAHVLESLLYFVLGFLTSALIALMISPAIWNRAVVLTRKRIEASVPLTLNEIQADKDQLRAEFAMSTRRLEMSVEELRDKASHQVIEINRKRDELAKLAEESRERIQTISELELRASDLREQLRAREEQLVLVTQRLDDTRAKMEARALELETLRTRLSQTETESDSHRIEVVAKQTVVDSLADRMEDAEQRERAARLELAALKEQHARALADIERERARNEDLAQRAARLEALVSDRENELRKREQALARMREAGGGEDGQLAELNRQLMREKGRNVELETRLAQSNLQMEALLNDASNDNVEKAMASMNMERSRLESDLASITAERDELRRTMSNHQNRESRDWELERRENAILRERINDLAAQVTAMTAALEGDNSPIGNILAKAPRLEGPGRNAVSEEKERPATLADRIRALQQTARQNKAG